MHVYIIVRCLPDAVENLAVIPGVEFPGNAAGRMEYVMRRAKEARAMVTFGSGGTVRVEKWNTASGNLEEVTTL